MKELLQIAIVGEHIFNCPSKYNLENPPTGKIPHWQCGCIFGVCHETLRVIDVYLLLGKKVSAKFQREGNVSTEVIQSQKKTGCQYLGKLSK